MVNEITDEEYYGQLIMSTLLMIIGILRIFGVMFLEVPVYLIGYLPLLFGLFNILRIDALRN